MNKSVIVCVDDEPLILNSLKVELRRTLSDQYIIEIAESGEEALELIEELLAEEIEIPLVISDYIMPQMKGDELLQRIHQINTKTLKIMLTGQASVEAVANAINRAKLYRYIAKPWEPEDLKLTVTEAIRSYFQDKQLTEQNAKLQQANQQLEQSNQEQATLINAYERFVPHQFLNLLGKKALLTFI
ncbi:response regulator [Beggiatoa sp. PS]|nr:response regulator [Beggiatoa sp. PS]